MKRKKHTSAEDEAQIDMTPMLDIVFIMLIFFIVTTSFVKEKGLDVNRPEDNQAKNDKPSKALSIRIDADGTIMMGGREVDIRRVVANAQTYLAENNTDTAAIQAHERPAQPLGDKELKARAGFGGMVRGRQDGVYRGRG